MATESKQATGTRTINAAEFKATCLELLDEVAESGEELVITKNGRPVSRLVPFREQPQSLFGIDRGRIEILGDIIEPIDVEWEAETDPDTGCSIRDHPRYTRHAVDEVRTGAVGSRRQAGDRAGLAVGRGMRFGHLVLGSSVAQGQGTNQVP